MSHHSKIADRQPKTERARRRSAVAATALATGAALALTGAVVQPAVAAPQTINLVTVNDFHGRIERDPRGGAVAGVAALATAVNEVRAANENTVFAAAGDLIGASTFTSFVQQDVPTIEALNAAGLDVSAAGNHEFDQGWADLRDRVQGLADWEYISANVVLEGTDDTALSESWTTTLPNGVTMGFVGAVTEELPSLVSPAGIAELEVVDIVDSVNAAADRLVDGVSTPDNLEADIVVLLVHEGATTTEIESATDPASAFGQIVLGVDDDVDAIVSGHTHLAYNHVIDGRPVISSGQYGEQFSNMTITYDPETGALTMDNVIAPLAPYPDDPEVAKIVTEAVAVADELGAVKVGEIADDFNRAQMPGLDDEGNPAIVESRGAESTLGNFVADVQLWAAGADGQQVDIAFMNPGGLRTDLTYAGTSADDPDGNVTYAEAANVQPFANTLFAMTLTGAQVVQVLEEQWQPVGASRPFLKLGVNEGLEVVYDPAAQAGSHITQVTLDGTPIDPAAEYRVVANSFLASGGDNFATLAEGTNRADTGRIDLQSMVDWFAEFGTATPDYAQRSVGVVLPPPANGTAYAPGETIRLALSSLEFSTTEPPAGEVTVSLGDTVLGTAPVDPTSVPTTDEGGRATLDITIPDGVVGAQALVISTPTGTEVEVPITVEDVVVPEPVGTYVIGLPSPFFVRGDAALHYRGWIVSDDGSNAVGTLTVSDGSQVIATAEIGADDGGEFTVELPALSRGVHVLSSSFDGAAPYTDSTSFRVPVLVW
ncbi:5'-nucleotidase C-terminal domain-containing protein [Agromyces laixinhei]|uniref:5'-nucleotidase C-terminal domain-containing protein n=1 Tax=Agromyces laixinhei TaxID=2585717 RepID=UPI0012EDE149|nr:5'-nucleotidase C-terminal domain-containing protein [Agromyces laixinhei]